MKLQVTAYCHHCNSAIICASQETRSARLNSINDALHHLDTNPDHILTITQTIKNPDTTTIYMLSQIKHPTIRKEQP